MLIAGLIMAKLRVRLWLWASLYVLAAAIIFTMTVNSYPSIEKALSKNGSWWAYVWGSTNMGLYVSVILASMITIIIRITNKIRGHELQAKEVNS